MKKLALMSVALGAVSIYGAGEADASVTFLSSAASLSSNDSAAWTANGLGGKTLSSVTAITGTNTYTTSTSIITGKGITVTGAESTHLTTGQTADLYYGLQNHSPLGTEVKFDFPTSTPLLYAAGAGSSDVFKITLSTPVLGVGFYVAPATGSPSGTTFDATAMFYGDTGGSHHLIGTDSTTGKIATSCAGSACTFIGLDTAGNTGIMGITSVLVEVGSTVGGDQYAPAISTVFLADPTGSHQGTIPEPASLSIVGAGLLGLGLVRRRQRNQGVPDGWRWSPFGRWRVAGIPPDQLRS